MNKKGDCHVYSTRPTSHSEGVPEGAPSRGWTGLDYIGLVIRGRCPDSGGLRRRSRSVDIKLRRWCMHVPRGWHVQYIIFPSFFSCYEIESRGDMCVRACVRACLHVGPYGENFLPPPPPPFPPADGRKVCCSFCAGGSLGIMDLCMDVWMTSLLSHGGGRTFGDGGGGFFCVVCSYLRLVWVLLWSKLPRSRRRRRKKNFC